MLKGLMNIDLRKKQDKVVSLMLDKGVKADDLSLRCGLALDISISMRRIIDSGDLQKAMNQIMGVAVTVDDDGNVDVFKFDDRCDYVGTATAQNYTNFVEKNGIVVRGGTNYSPIVHAAIGYFADTDGGQPVQKIVEPAKKGLFGFGKKEAVVQTTATSDPKVVEPTLFQIITDGECGDKGEIDRLLARSVNQNVYWQFIGVGPENFRTIKNLADKYDHVGDVYLRDFGLSDDEVYAQVISDELVSWVKKVA